MASTHSPPPSLPSSPYLFVAMGETDGVVPATVRSSTTLCRLLFLISHIQGALGVVIGVNYGRIANNLPPPPQVSQFLVQNTIINHIKLFDSDPSILQAFAHTNLSINVAVSNTLIPHLTSLKFAHQWVQSNILPFTPSTNITRILVGNEVVSTADKSIIAGLLPAMQNLHTALAGESLHRRIQISSPHSLAILSQSSPPSAGRFRHGYDTEVIRPLLSFLRATNSPFMINAYPYFGFTQDTLNYALFRPNSGVVDKNTGLTYTNMLDGQLDAVFSAMKLLGFIDVDIVIAETGWPSDGDPWQIGVGVESARDYNLNLLRHVNSGVGTPLMPNRRFETYIFSLFNEDLKPGPTSERNFGLFRPDMTPVYDTGILRTPFKAHVNPTPSHMKHWCVPRSDTDAKSLQAIIDFVCGQGVDCRPIQEGGACFLPDTVQAHAAFAMNAYYQTAGRNPFDCDFGEKGLISVVDPSYGTCKYNS